MARRMLKCIVHEYREEKRDSGMEKSEKRVQAQEAIRQIIENDNFVSVRHIASEFGLSKTMVHEILTKDLELQWVTIKLVPHKLNDLRKANRVTRCQDLIESLSYRLARKNFVTINENSFIVET